MNNEEQRPHQSLETYFNWSQFTRFQYIIDGNKLNYIRYVLVDGSIVFCKINDYHEVRIINSESEFYKELENEFDELMKVHPIEKHTVYFKGTK